MKKGRSFLLFLIWISTIDLFSQTVSNFTLENVQNEKLQLNEIKGSKLTIIDFWATWCKPCTNAMPKLNTIYSKYKDKGLCVIGISCDGPRSVSRIAPVVSSLKIDYPILKDINCEVMNTYQFQSFPTLLLLNEKNEIVWVHEGFSNGDEVKIEKEIMKRLQ